MQAGPDSATLRLDTVVASLDAARFARPRGRGLPLASLVAGGRMPLPRALAFAQALARALAVLHADGKVHGRLRPEVIRFDPQTGELELDEASRAFDPALGRIPVASELASITWQSPEMSGRTSHEIDARADLYSLGCLLHYALDGRPPFDADDALAMVHAHVAQPAPRLAAQPAAVADLVACLLEKSPARRYRSVVGLSHDLRQLPHEAPLRAHDPSPRVLAPQRLLGRSAALADVAELLAQPRSPVVLVTGQPGVGRSHFVRVLRERSRAALFGRFDRGWQGVHRVLAYLVKQHAARLLVGEPAARDAAKRRLTEALGAQGRVVTDLATELEQLVGPQPDVPQLAPAAADARFTHVFAKLLRALPTPGERLLVILEDLHLADDAALATLRAVLLGGDLGELAFVFTASSADDRLRAVTTALAAAHRIDLAPLERSAFEQLVADVLAEDLERSQPIAALLHERTQGSPFSSLQLLREWIDQRSLHLDLQTGNWAWNTKALGRGGVGTRELVERRVAQLASAGAHALETAACLGVAFFPPDIAAVSDEPLADVERTIDAAISAGLVQRVPAHDAVLFVSDVVHSVYLARVSTRLRAEISARHATALYRRYGDGEERTFEMARAFAAGETCLDDASLRAAARALCQRAGERTQQAGAHASAVTYLRGAFAYAGGIEALVRGARSNLELGRALVEALYSQGSTAEADALLAALLRVTPHPRDRAGLHEVEILHLTHTGRFREATTAGLGMLDGVIPSDPGAWNAAVPAAIAAATQARGARTAADLAAQPACTDPQIRAELRLLALLSQAAYNFDADLFSLLVLRMVERSLVAGPTENTSFSFATYAILLGPGLGDFAAAAELGALALTLAERFRNDASLARVLHLHATFVRWWSEPLEATLPALRRARGLALESGDPIYAGLAAIVIVMHRLAAGARLDLVLGETQALLGDAIRTNDASTVAALTSARQLARALRGETRELASLDDEHFDTARFLADPAHAQLRFARAFHHATQLELDVLARSPRAAASARAALESAPGMFGLLGTRRIQLFAALAIAWDGATPLPSRLERLAPLAADLRVWAERSPHAFASHADLLDGEIALLRGDRSTARAALESALGSARCPSDEALAHERLADLLRSQGSASASAHARAAHATWQSWGATALAAAVARRHELTEDPRPDLVASPRGDDALDTLAILRAAQAISEPVETRAVLTRLLRVVMETAGAESVYLALTSDDGLVLGAEALGSHATVIDPPVPIAQRDDLPLSILAHVVRTRSAVLLGDAQTDPTFAADPAVRSHGKRSILTVPLVAHGRLVGIVHLENALVEAAFGPQRLELLQLLSGTCATAIVNARLYDDLKAATARLEDHAKHLEHRVTERTHEISDKNTELVAALDRVREGDARLQSELDEAAAYVRSLLPAPIEAPVRVSWMFVPSSELGGDGLGYHLLEDGSLALYVLDVCGHGVASALLGVTILSTLRSGGLANARPSSPASVLAALNRAFPVQAGGLFFTIWYGVIDPARGVLRYASGGHPGAVLFDPAGAAEELTTFGPMVGVFPGADFEESEVAVAPGSTLFAFTDGAYEIETEGGRLLSYDDFVLQLGRARTATDPLQSMLEFARGHAKKATLDDDLAMVWTRF